MQVRDKIRPRGRFSACDSLLAPRFPLHLRRTMLPSRFSVESLDSSASLALYWPVPPSTFALSPDDLAALQADPATLQAYQTAMLDAGA